MKRIAHSHRLENARSTMMAERLPSRRGRARSHNVHSATALPPGLQTIGEFTAHIPPIIDPSIPKLLTLPARKTSSSEAPRSTMSYQNYIDSPQVSTNTRQAPPSPSQGMANGMNGGM